MVLQVEVAEYEDFGRGIVTLKPIKKNELVMSFPTSVRSTILHQSYADPCCRNPGNYVGDYGQSLAHWSVHHTQCEPYQLNRHPAYVRESELTGFRLEVSPPLTAHCTLCVASVFISLTFRIRDVPVHDPTLILTFTLGTCRPWIEALPQTIETAMTATDTEISEIQDAESENEIKEVLDCAYTHTTVMHGGGGSPDVYVYGHT